MAKISENYQAKKLKEFGINIKTKYAVKNKILERNTNNSINDDITNGVRCEKDYYLNNNLIHSEKLFDSRVEYTFISSLNDNKDYTCPNCGMTSKTKDFIDGCPYCKTYYNIDYTDKDLGGKYHYDMVLRKTTYRVITLIVDFIVSLILCYLFIKSTSRTFNNFDIYKIFIYGIILSLILYYVFYILDAYIILGPIKIYKNKQNQKQIDFWNKTSIDKKSFFNNFNYEIRKYYYSKNNIIDYDLLDYISFKQFKKNNKFYIIVEADVRIVYYINGIISSKITTESYIFRHNDNGVLELKAGINIIKCHNCGASIDATASECNYCHSEIKYLQEWILEKD